MRRVHLIWGQVSPIVNYRDFLRELCRSGSAAEPIDLPFGLWTRVGQKKHEFNCIRQVALKSPTSGDTAVSCAARAQQ